MNDQYYIWNKKNKSDIITNVKLRNNSYQIAEINHSSKIFHLNIKICHSLFS